jgi:hypothetical protein
VRIGRVRGVSGCLRSSRRLDVDREWIVRRRQRLRDGEEVLDPVGVVLKHLLLQDREALFPDKVSESLDVTLEPLNQITPLLPQGPAPVQRGR